MGAATVGPGPSMWREAPRLSGALVTLTAVEPNHAAGLLRAADDDDVFTHLGVARPTTLDDAEQLVREALNARAAGTAISWVQMVNGEVAGLTTFYDLLPARRSLAIGSTWLGRRWQRTGVNGEAKLLLLSRAFDVLGCVRVVWHVDERNAVSRAAVLALGATEEGELRKHKRRRDGSWRTTVQFSMTDDDWPACRERLVIRASARA